MHWQWFGIYEILDVEKPKLLRLICIQSACAADAYAKATHGDPAGGVIGTNHVHAIQVANYFVPREERRTVRWFDGESWHDPVQS